MGDRLAERITGPGAFVLRRWLQDDAETLGDAVMESIELLRPWMPWTADEPLSAVHRRALIDGWERDWLAGGDVVMGVFVNGSVAGGCGLHRRISPGGLEIGYWTHDQANVASAGIPRKLGFQLVREVCDGADAPAEIGRSCEWQLTREAWDRTHAQLSSAAWLSLPDR